MTPSKRPKRQPPSPKTGWTLAEALDHLQTSPETRQLEAIDVRLEELGQGGARRNRSLERLSCLNSALSLDGKVHRISGSNDDTFDELSKQRVEIIKKIRQRFRDLWTQGHVELWGVPVGANEPIRIDPMLAPLLPRMFLETSTLFSGGANGRRFQNVRVFNGRRDSKPPGRKVGTGYRRYDAPLWAEMHKLIVSGKASSATEAARLVGGKNADHIRGSGAPESRQKRLVRGYQQQHSGEE